MTDLTYFRAILLGVIQALTEFLPVSSSGHLALVQQRMGLSADGPSLLLFDVATHVGTLVAVLAVFRRPIMRFLRRCIWECTSKAPPRRFAMRIVGLGITASVPTAIIGVTLKDRLQSAFGNPSVIAAGLAVTGGLLIATAFVPRGRLGWKRFPWMSALLVGVGQGLALVPGLSRSGTTICIAEYAGLKRRWAAEFSFLIAFPAIVGAAVLELRGILVSPTVDLHSIPWGPIGAGTVVASVVGYGALNLLLAVVRRAKLHYFAFYCWALALFAILAPQLHMAP